MLTEEQRADAYREVTDSTRHLVRLTRNNARQEQRLKPDLEDNRLAEVDREEGATWNEHVPQATPLRASRCA
jgi:hypothetical protein